MFSPHNREWNQSLDWLHYFNHCNYSQWERNAALQFCLLSIELGLGNNGSLCKETLKWTQFLTPRYFTLWYWNRYCNIYFSLPANHTPAGVSIKPSWYFISRRCGEQSLTRWLHSLTNGNNIWITCCCTSWVQFAPFYWPRPFLLFFFLLRRLPTVE